MGAVLAGVRLARGLPHEAVAGGRCESPLSRNRERQSTDMQHITNIFSPETTPGHSIVDLSMFVLSITGIIFVVVVSLLVYVLVKFRSTPTNVAREPAQVYGSTQIELAWT